MGGSFIKIEGLDKALARFDVKSFREKVLPEMSRFAANIEQDAKQYVPVDEGLLKSSIFAETDAANLTLTVGARAKYASYVEFGTRKFAAAYVSTLPAQWQQLAATTKGKGGGTLNDFVQNIMAWVLRKGIGSARTKSGKVSMSKKNLDNLQQIAYSIALSILRKGIRAQPYLYPAIHYKNRQKFIDAIKAIKL